MEASEVKTTKPYHCTRCGHDSDTLKLWGRRTKGCEICGAGVPKSGNAPGGFTYEPGKYHA